MFMISVKLYRYVKRNVILEYTWMLGFIPNLYKTLDKYEKAVGNFPITLKYAPDCYKTQEMCNIAVNPNSSTLMHVLYTCPFMLNYVPDCDKFQKACGKYFFDRFKTSVDLKPENSVKT